MYWPHLDTVNHVTKTKFHSWDCRHYASLVISVGVFARLRHMTFVLKSLSIGLHVYMVCMTYGMYDIWYVWYMVCMIYGMYDIWYVWYMICMIYGMYDIWYVWYMVCMIYGMNDIWYVWYMVCMIYGWYDIWYVWYTVGMIYGMYCCDDWMNIINVFVCLFLIRNLSQQIMF